MNKRIFWVLTLLCLFAIDTQSFAQYPNRPMGPVSQPTVSPYLNLLRRGNSAGVNYYGLVRPIQQGQQNAQAVQGQLQNIQNNLTEIDSGPTELSATGFVPTFMNYGGYFQMGSGMRGRGMGNRGMGGMGGGGMGGSNGFRPGMGGGGFGGGGGNFNNSGIGSNFGGSNLGGRSGMSGIRR